jgi:hypothetical protein|tara:strand:- start:495 stop:1013 length:519 start_codon:yes stop_codon:yes gene_type:complete
MSNNIIKKLTELKVEDSALLTVSYSEGADVWHINESHVEETVGETDTASMFASLLTSGIPVYSQWGSADEGADILNQMRSNGALDDYDRDGYFEDFIQGVLAETIYDNEYDLEYSTQQYDYKRGRCEISVAVRCRAGDLYAQDKKADATSVDSALGAFELTVDTDAGTLTLK